MNSSTVRLLLVLGLVSVILAACGTSSASTDSTITSAEATVASERADEAEEVPTTEVADEIDADAVAETSVAYPIVDTGQDDLL